jgi:hypothetical protein
MLLYLSFFLFISLWVKSNNIIYFPFVFFVLVFNFWKKRNFISILLPIIAISASYLLLKYLNGSGHVDLMNSSASHFNLVENVNRAVFFTNLYDYIFLLGDIILSPLVSLRLIPFLFIPLTILLYVFIFLNKNNVSNKFIYFILLYIFLYTVVFFIFQQYIHASEINGRTLITVIFILLILVLSIIYGNVKLKLIILPLFLLINIFYLNISNFKRAQTQNKETINDIHRFKKRSSLTQFKNIIDSKNLHPQFVYTNERRLFSFAYNYNLVSAIPQIGSKYFDNISGKMILIDSAYAQNGFKEISKKLSNNIGCIIIFNVNDDNHSIYYNLGDTTVKNGSDIIIY